MKEKKNIGQYKQNNKLDLDTIINEYSGYVYKIIENMGIWYLSEEDIEEIISDTFFIVWKNREILEEDKFLSPYIAGITKNLVREKTRVIKLENNIEDYENIIQDFYKIDMACELREKVSMIEKSVQKMKVEDKEIFKLYYYSSRKISEIAKILNTSEFGVKSRLYRIRRKIKNDLQKGGYSDENR